MLLCRKIADVHGASYEIDGNDGGIRALESCDFPAKPRLKYYHCSTTSTASAFSSSKSQGRFGHVHNFHYRDIHIEIED
jgi:hypothetical protein